MTEPVNEAASHEGRRVLINAPYGSDNAVLVELLMRQGYQAQAYASVTELAEEIDTNTAVVILTDESLADDLSQFSSVLEQQPPWSEIPLILLASRHSQGKESQSTRLRLPVSANNTVFLERPLGSESLISAVRSATRSRLKQLEMRDRLLDLSGERAKLKALVDNLPVGVCFMDTNGHTVFSNPIYEQFVPERVIPSKLVASKDHWSSIDAGGNPLDISEYPGARALRGESVFGSEFKFTPPEGDPRWARVSATPLYDSAGEIMGAAAAIIDIDAEKRNDILLRQFNLELENQVSARTQALEDALESLKSESEERARAEDQLRQSLKMEAVGQLTGGIAHDFNNMLTGVIGSLDIMRSRIEKARYQELGKFMDAAQSSAIRAAALTQRLLAFSRRQSLEATNVEINSLIESLSDLLERSITEQISINFEFDHSIDKARVDVNQLESAILNLAINARDAMPHGGSLTIRTSMPEVDTETARCNSCIEGQYIAVEVQDTGIGIAPEQLSKVFEPFFTTKPIGQGTGLGLSMVYGFAQQSQGFVKIKSHVGQGTTVKIFLPRATEETITSTEFEKAAVSNGLGRTVLVVEDDESVRILLEVALDDLGYQVLVAEHAAQALDILKGIENLDLLVSDVGLPGMNGRQLAEIVQQHYPGLPVVFVTGYAKAAAAREEFLGPRMTMIDKPFTLEQLGAAVSSMF
jgi:signal transduction histidine kinase/FixJ family two-component response regulator